MTCSRCKKRVAVVFLNRMENGEMMNEGLCIKCAKELGIKPIDDIVKRMGISDDDIDMVNDQLMEVMESDGEDAFQPGGAMPFPFLQNLFDNQSGGEVTEQPERREKSKRVAEDTREKEKKFKFLDTYCEDLTDKAARGRIDRIIGREKEIYRVIQILNRRTKNNPCLIGEPGVGKTAIAEGIAQKLAHGDVPAKLIDKRLYMLDLTGLVAGTQFRGQFESRVKGLVEDIKKAGNVILFIDEVHSLVGAGDAEGSMNAANILKPALSRGEIQVIGATTFTEYRKQIEKDAALERRFQPVKVNEPTVEETIEVIKGIKKYYESFHRVTVSDELAARCVTLSERYIIDRFLPDKAIDLLDEACSCASLRNHELAQFDRFTKRWDAMVEEEAAIEQNPNTAEVDYEKLANLKGEIAKLDKSIKEISGKALGMAVTEEDLAKVVELWTGIPASKIQETELKRVSGLEAALKAKIIGQDEAVELVAAAVRRSRVQISGRRRPASFIFVGPTGVGKTELVKVLASEMFSDTDPLIRLDMSEFMEKHSVSRIIGSPPGYVGYDEAGQLTEKVRRRPYSVVLFDEIEKAHPDVMNILLQILDEGKITDAQGRNVNFENTIIVMTSNAGSEIKEGALGFNKQPYEVAKDKANKSLSQFLRPEFIARVDEVVVFRPLDEGDFKRIAMLMLDELKTPLDERGIKFDYAEEAVALIAKQAFGHKSGARDLRRIIRKEAEDKICLALVDHPEAAPALVKLVAEDETLKLLTA